MVQCVCVCVRGGVSNTHTDNYMFEVATVRENAIKVNSHQYHPGLLIKSILEHIIPCMDEEYWSTSSPVWTRGEGMTEHTCVCVCACVCALWQLTPPSVRGPV